MNREDEIEDVVEHWCVGDDMYEDFSWLVAVARAARRVDRMWGTKLNPKEAALREILQDNNPNK